MKIISHGLPTQLFSAISVYFLHNNNEHSNNNFHGREHHHTLWVYTRIIQKYSPINWWRSISPPTTGHEIVLTHTHSIKQGKCRFTSTCVQYISHCWGPVYKRACVVKLIPKQNDHCSLSLSHVDPYSCKLYCTLAWITPQLHHLQTVPGILQSSIDSHVNMIASNYTSQPIWVESLSFGRTLFCPVS